MGKGTWTIELSGEVESWYLSLGTKDRAQADRVFDLLAAEGPMLGMPLSKQLGAGLRELRFSCEGVHRRVTYYLRPEHQAITLTTFRKQRQNERHEVERARKANASRQREERVSMARTLGEVRAAHPPADQDEYERAYTASTLALDLARLAYQMRDQAGLSQRELARRMHTTQSAIARLESGSVVPRLGLLARLSHATGIPLRLDTGTRYVNLGHASQQVA